MRKARIFAGAAAMALALPVWAQPEWNFAVAGDSRNCGDIVMPEIARGAIEDHALFYWHLGDFRATYTFDQDYLATHPNPTIAEYLFYGGWQDFIERQLEPFAHVRVFLGIGNHELIPPRRREEFIAQFADWLDAPPIRAQRLADDPHDRMVRTWYHWTTRGVDFINLDNGSTEQFEKPQMDWLMKLLDRDAANAGVRVIVVGMHEALPGSIAFAHSMDDAPAAKASGTAVYERLVRLRRESGKPVYILASHSHFYMANIFNTAANRARDAVLPGWIIGTAGAERYPLPKDTGGASAAETNVYGYATARVRLGEADPIRIEFHRIEEKDVPPGIVETYGEPVVHGCFAGNSRAPR
jgi:hypothetical protein